MYRKIVNVDALFVIFTSDDRNTIIGRSGAENIHIGKALATSAVADTPEPVPRRSKAVNVTATDQGNNCCRAGVEQNRKCPHLRHHVFSGDLGAAIDAHARGPEP